MYTIYVVFDCIPGKREAFVERVKKEGILAAVREEDGCKKYDYYLGETVFLTREEAEAKMKGGAE